MEIKGGIADNTKKLLNLIILVILLLSLCVAVDYATNITVDNLNESEQAILTDTIKVNDTHYVIDQNNTDGMVKVRKVVVEKPKVPTITITSKPSCGCRYSYTWHTKTYVNYCPNCHRYGVLGNKHKRNARYEQEITCFHCDSDFCGCCGKEKYSWSRTYLRKV